MRCLVLEPHCQGRDCLTMAADRMPASGLWALGFTQILGYGTLFYSFSILASDMALEFGWTEQSIFGAFSLALLLAGLVSPTAGRLADRYGAGRIMTAGSFVCALALLASAAAPNGFIFVLLLAVTQAASTLVLYSAAFVAIVQFGGSKAQRSIVHLTLIAGFASTLFWPLTTFLHELLSWRSVYVAFALIHLAVCAPLHAMIAAQSRRQSDIGRQAANAGAGEEQPGIAFSAAQRQAVFILLLAGFALEGLTLSAILVHLVPLTQALGMGSMGLFVAGLFGPAQVASRFTNMLFGGRLSQTWLAVISSALLPIGLAVLIATAPSAAGGVLFAVLIGLGSGLNSIVSGTLPLELFGRKGYGALLGWVTAARQTASALAPFGLSLAMAHLGVAPSLGLAGLTGAGALVCFGSIVVLTTRRRMAVAC